LQFRQVARRLEVMSACVLTLQQRRRLWPAASPTTHPITQVGKPGTRNEPRYLIAALALAGAVALAAISRNSFWIDEGWSAYKAIQPTFSSWWGAMLWEHNQNTLLPLYMFFLWVWEKVFGPGEWALRMLNAPCFLLTVVGLWLAFREDQRRFCFSIIFLGSNAFVWFYLDQARPYTLLLMGSTLLFAGAYRLGLMRSEFTRRWAYYLAVSALLLSATSIIGAVWSAATLIALWCMRGWRFPVIFFRASLGAFSLLCVGLLLMAGYYLWWLHMGMDARSLKSTSVMNVAFVPYELLGFAGLGPGRNALRDHPLSVLGEYSVPLAIYGLLWTGLVLRTCKRLYTQATQRRRVVFYGLLATPGAVLILVAYWLDLRLLPRHLTPLMPLVICLAGWLLERSWKHGLPGKALVAGFMIVSLVSAGQIRLATRHRQDNYRHAAAIAEHEISAGRTVLWAADRHTALYYGVVADKDRDTGSSMLMIGDLAGEHLRLKPSAVLLSKHDLYDPEGRISSYVRANGYTLSESFEAFELWVLRPTNHSAATN